MNKALMACLFLLAGIDLAQAQAGLKLLTTIAVPGKPLHSYDLGYVDQTTHRYYLADRTNKAIDVFDTQTNKFIGRIGGLTGDRPDGSGGPNSMIVAGGNAFIFDGDSAVRIADLGTDKIVATVSTGGNKQADESGYDDKDHIVVATNGSDAPPFITFISTDKPYKLLGKLVIDKATDGVEQPVYDPASGMVFISIPQFGKKKTLGAVLEVDPKSFKLVKTMTFEGCNPHGMVLGADGNLLLGCHSTKPPPAAALLDPKTGQVRRISGIAASDQVAYNAAAGQYYVTGNHMPGGPVFGVIDAKTNKWLGNISVPGNPHSIATEETSKHVFVPVPGGSSVCLKSCIAVYGPS